MALFVKQDETRTKLQERVAAELQERAKARAQGSDLPDGVHDTQYLKDTKVTTSLAWVWAVIALVALGVLIWVIINNL